MSRTRFVFPKEVLLIQIDRRCEVSDCCVRAWLSLTKEEARVYSGFECERCGAWNDDVLESREIPTDWKVIAITSESGASN